MKEFILMTTSTEDLLKEANHLLLGCYLNTKDKEKELQNITVYIKELMNRKIKVQIYKGVK